MCSFGSKSAPPPPPPPPPAPPVLEQEAPDRKTGKSKSNKAKNGNKGYRESAPSTGDHLTNVGSTGLPGITKPNR